jgi:hypothetical protein
VNFFGHARVAVWVSIDPTFVLGAMLPDFATMSASKLPAQVSLAFDAGIAHHHDADQIFHDSPAFIGLTRRAYAALRDRGVPRGPALGTAHVGTELLLDGVLANIEAATVAYVNALECGATRLPGLGASPDLLRVVEVLREKDALIAYRSGAGVADRVCRALSRRPRLRPGPTDQAQIADWAEAFRDVVAAATPELMLPLEQRFSHA